MAVLARKAGTLLLGLMLAACFPHQQESSMLREARAEPDPGAVILQGHAEEANPPFLLRPLQDAAERDAAVTRYRIDPSGLKDVADAASRNWWIVIPGQQRRAGAGLVIHQENGTAFACLQKPLKPGAAVMAAPAFLVGLPEGTTALVWQNGCT